MAQKQVLGLQDFNIQNTETCSPVSFANYIRALMQNWRQGTVAVKDRGDLISRSNKKPWKQKGTGRARAGSARSPLWRGGGIIFGPQERVRTLKVSQSHKNNVLRSLFIQKLMAGKVIALDWMPSDTPKTADAYKMLKNNNVHEHKTAFFVTNHDVTVHASLNNVPNIRLMLFDQPNAFALVHADSWVFLQKDLDFFKKMVNTWI